MLAQAYIVNQALSLASPLWLCDHTEFDMPKQMIALVTSSVDFSGFFFNSANTTE